MKKRLDREVIAMRVARELKDGDCVNLGIGIPTLVSNFVHDERTIVFQSENGVIGYGPYAAEGEEDPDLYSAAGQYVTLMPGACFVHHADSFAMIRGGHIDVAILGGMQVSERGDLANWKRPEKKTGGIGGGMDLAAGARKIIVAMEHTTPDGKPKIVKECTYPLTAKRCVDLIVTDLAVIEVTEERLVLKEITPGFTVEEVQAVTEPKLLIAADLKEMEL